MKHLIRACIAALALSLVASAAHAKRAGSSWEEQLLFVSETNYMDLSLCHLVKVSSIFMVTLNTKSLGYALAENECDADSFYPFDAEEMREAQAEGIIPAHLPVVPELTPAQERRNMLTYVLVGLGLVLAAMKKFGLSPRFGKKRPKVAATSDMRHALLTAMCAVARADGHIASSEVEQIRAIYKSLTRKTLSRDDVSEFIRESIRGTDAHILSAQAEAMSPQDRELILRAGLMVAHADGAIHKEEWTLLSTHAQALQMPITALKQMVQQLPKAKPA